MLCWLDGRCGLDLSDDMVGSRFDPTFDFRVSCRGELVEGVFVDVA